MKRIKFWLDNYSKRLFLILLAVALLCYACMWLIESNFASVQYDKQNFSLTELSEVIKENNSAYGKDIEISFTPTTTTNITIMTMKPSNASEETPVPLIVACHGSNDTMQSYLMACAELTRRGYGVVLFDGQGHGESTISLGENTHNTGGFEAALEYGMSLPWVDETNVGITGHSWGSRQVNAVTNYVNSNTRNHIKAALYVGSGQGLGMDPQESEIYLGALAGIYDEHLNNMDGNGSYDLSSQRNARVQADWIWPDFSEDEVDPEWLAGRGGSAPLDFGDDATLEIGSWYTKDGVVPFDPMQLNVEPGSVIFFNPSTTHEGTVYNEESITYFVQFFQSTLGTPAGVNYIPANEQVSQFSKYFSFIGFCALFLMLFPLFNLVIKMDFFKKLCKTDDSTPDGALPSFRSVKGQTQFWLTSIITVGFALFSFFVICEGDTGGSPYFPGNARWPATYVNHYLLWMMAQGIFNMLFYCLINGVQEWRAKKKGEEAAGMLTVIFRGSTLMDVFRSILFAGILMFAFWGVVRIGWDFFHTTIRYSLVPNWYLPVQIRPFPYSRLLLLPRYLPFFAIAWIPMTVGIAGSRYRDIPEWIQSIISGVLNALPLIIFLVYEYAGFFGPTHNVTNYDIYWLGGMVKTFVIPLFIIGILTRYMYRKTKNVWVAAAFNTLFIAVFTLSSLMLYWDAVIM